MKLLAASLLLGLLLLNIPVAATFEDCSCSAADGTCSASNSCLNRGCIAVCIGNGSCRATCSGEPGFEEGGYILTKQISMQQVGSNSKEVSSELARITGQPVVFSPFRADDTISLDVKKAALWDVLEVLSASGKVEIGGDDFTKLQNIRKALVTGEKMSVCIHGASLKRVISEFSSLSGLRIHATPGKTNTLVNLRVKDVTLEELLAQLGRQGGVEISVR